MTSDYVKLGGKDPKCIAVWHSVSVQMFKEYSDNPSNDHHQNYQTKWNRIIGTVIFVLVLCLLFNSTQNRNTMIIYFLSFFVIFIIYIPVLQSLLRALGFLIEFLSMIKAWFRGY